MVRYVLTGLILTAISFSVSSQSPKRANFWYFGEQAGLDFTQGHPVPLTDGAMKAFEGSAVMSDASGNLLFYTNGGDMPYNGGVWNRNHQLMPNGDLTGAGGCGSSFQSSLILPHPRYEHLYYLFTTDCIENGSAGGLRYSIIDMTLDEGLGDVSTKDVLLTTPVDESLTAIQHANGSDYWIVCHKLRTDSFYVYHLSMQGISGLVKKKIGPVTPDYAGSLKASINGEKLVYSGLSFTALFDFNNSTGVISNHVNLGIPSYSASFSPNCELLYVADGVNKRLFQFEIIHHDIPTTKVQVGATSSIGLGGMQLGPDNRIYIARFVTSNYLGVIMHPDLKGDDCIYVDDGIYLGGRQGKGGLPNFPNNMIGECLSYPVENISDYSQFNLGMNNTGRNPFITEQGNMHLPAEKTGEAAVMKEFNFSVFPNPAGAFTTVTIRTGASTPVDIFVMEMSGKVLKEFNYNNISGAKEFRIPLDFLTNGIYNIAVETEEIHRVQKLIVLK